MYNQFGRHRMAQPHQYDNELEHPYDHSYTFTSPIDSIIVSTTTNYGRVNGILFESPDKSPLASIQAVSNTSCNKQAHKIELGKGQSVVGV
jgi:hypothetical protein